ncbi:MAG: hypothetical protein U0667_01120 [Chloroflexota bacterium]
MPVRPSRVAPRPALLGALLAGLALATTSSTLAQAPSVAVEPTGELPAGAATLTVTGTGFATAGSGIYVVFGPITPPPGYYTDASIYGAFTWVHAGASGSPVEAELAADGSFSTALNVTSVFATGAGNVDCTVTACAVITFAAHGSPDRSQDTCSPVVFVGTASASPAAASPSPVAAATPSAAPPASIAPTDPTTPTTAEGCALIGATAP